jgi:hypothetical protein
MNPSPQQTPFPFACQRWRDHRGIYRPPNEVISTHDYEVAPITLTQAKAFVTQHHYSRSYVACRYRYGLFKRYALFPEDELVGVAVFSMPMSQKVLTNIFTCDPLESIELGRFVLLDHVPSNAESWFFARCRELLKRDGIKGIVAFSDDTPRTTLESNYPIFAGHIGNFYQASNGVYLKRTTPRTLKLLRDGSVFSDRAASKIRKLERGWRYAANILVKHGATQPPSDNPAALKTWLRYWTTTLTRPLKHAGNHRYCWSLSSSVSLPPSHSYPKWPNQFSKL